jgi:hypothetical protein
MIATFVTALLSVGMAPTAASPQEESARRPAYDPDRVVCESIKITGSRLGRQRVCMTAEQWSEERRQTRQGVERLQVRGLRDKE